MKINQNKSKLGRLKGVEPVLFSFNRRTGESCSFPNHLSVFFFPFFYFLFLSFFCKKTTTTTTTTMSAGKDFQLVRMKSGKHNFEVMTNPGSVHKYRKGELDISQVLFTEMIFKNQVCFFVLFLFVYFIWLNFSSFLSLIFSKKKHTKK